MKPSYRATMWAEMKPDVYAGPRCDKVRPQWEIHADGDMGGADTERALKLAARTFPPGTKITISEPCCPECGELREPVSLMVDPLRKGPLYAGPCRCGFDWDRWTLDEYS